MVMAVSSSSSLSSSSARVITKVAGNFGRLWRQGHESFSPQTRRILQIKGKGATTYLQGLVTCDLQSPPPIPREEKQQPEQDEITNGNDKDEMVEFSDLLRAACFLDSKGRILTDSLLWKVNEHHYFVDVPHATADSLLMHLKQFILRRSQVKVDDLSNDMSSHVVYGTLNTQGTPQGYLAGLDPRHPSLGMRVLSMTKENENINNDNNSTTTSSFSFDKLMSSLFPNCPGTYNVIRKFAGIAEGLELTGKIAGECNQEFLGAVSFRKGCYLGQELTARVQYTGAIRKRIMPLLLLDVNMQIPKPWMIASQIQNQQQLQLQQQQTQTTEQTNHVPSRLPRLSVSFVGNLIASMSSPSSLSNNTNNDKDDLRSRHQLQAQSEALFQQLQSTIEKGQKIVDIKDGKTIGQIIAPPEPGTNVVLAQVRLDKVGLLASSSSSSSDGNSISGVWSPTNKIVIGDQNDDYPLRYLPYLPLWWPPVDPETGKAKE